MRVRALIVLIVLQLAFQVTKLFKTASTVWSARDGAIAPKGAAVVAYVVTMDLILRCGHCDTVS